VEDTGFEKKGQQSVGVARQYTGTVGKITNCQVTVNCHYAERTVAWPVATRLYLPEEWVADADRRKRAHVPPEIGFQTKAQIALALLDEARACQVAHACITGDADYGDNPNFLNGLEDRGERYVMAVRASFRVTLGRRPSSPVQRADVVLAAQPLRVWRTIGVKAVRAGNAPRGWPCGVGGLMGMARAMGAGSSANARVVTSRESGNISGAISHPRRRWRSCWSMPIAATGWSSIRKKRKRSGAGISSRAAGGRGFIATRLR
jgi:hypothetical protein